MNLRIEACIQCPVQCKLEERSARVVVFATSVDPVPTSPVIRGEVSRMVQEAGRIGCPTSEINRIRKETFEQVDPKLINPWRHNLGNTPSDLKPDPTRRETYAQYGYRTRKFK